MIIGAITVEALLSALRQCDVVLQGDTEVIISAFCGTACEIGLRICTLAHTTRCVASVTKDRNLETCGILVSLAAWDVGGDRRGCWSGGRACNGSRSSLKGR